MESKSLKKNLSLKRLFQVIDVAEMQTGKFNPVKVTKENDVLIFVTDEPEFIDFLKSEGISGRMRSTQSQRVRDEQGKI